MTRPLVGILRREPAGDAPSALWIDVVAFADTLGLSPIVHRRLRDAEQALPADAAEKLRMAYLGSAAANMRLFHEIGRILRAAGAADLAVIPLKGAFLAEAVYHLIAMEHSLASTSSAIKSLLCAGLPGELPTFADIAQALHTSESSLRRRLAGEGTSYQAIKDEVRCELATDHLLGAQAVLE